MALFNLKRNKKGDTLKLITENISTLKINKLTQAQYERELAAGRIDEYALYLTPDEEVYYTQAEIDTKLDEKADSSVVVKTVNDVSPDESNNVKITWNELGTEHNITILEEMTIVDSSGNSMVPPTPLPIVLIDGNTYIVTFDNVEYECLARGFSFDGLTFVYIGNQVYSGGLPFPETIESNEPFFIGRVEQEDITMIITSDDNAHTIKISGDNYNLIPKEYLPEEALVGKLGTGMFAEIFNYNIPENASGDSSHAEGIMTVASGVAAHAEGMETVAEGEASHAEGALTIAVGNAAHAEGMETIAKGEAQHVQGRFNIEDSTGTYAHIVGNGSYDSPSNAHTLDWGGNAWFAGNVYVGGTGKNDSVAEKVALKSDIDKLNSPKAGILLIDQVNGCTYVLQMQNGSLVTFLALSGIEVTTMPTKTEYMAGE